MDRDPLVPRTPPAPNGDMGVFEQFDGGCEIDPGQALLLRALLLHAPRDRECFARWLAEVDLDAIDPAQLRLIPALYRKFGAAKAGDSRIDRLGSTYRYWVLRNSLLVADARRVMERLRDAGIELLLFKGLATTLKYHRDIAVRPMTDVDVLVRPESVAKAGRILHRLGWKHADQGPRHSADLHSTDYINERREGFDLHWYSLYESPFEGIDAGLWQRARPFDWEGLDVALMAPEDLLLTGMVNGLRVGDPLRLNWIHDLACIVAAEPQIAWPTLWQEAGRRGLRRRVFDALTLVRDVSSEIVSDALLRSFVDGDPDLCRELLVCALEEGRTHGLRRERRERIEAILGAGGAPGAAYERVANAPGSPRHVHFSVNGNRAIDRLFLQRRHLPLLAELFEVRDPAWLRALVASEPATGEGYVSVPPGQLAMNPQPEAWTCTARIVIVEAPPRLELFPGESHKLRLQVENLAPRCWAIGSGSKAVLGVSYHLYAEDGELRAWDFPRVQLLVARSGYVAFIEPSQKVACELSIVAPAEPGRYRVRLDLVQEYVAWFSNLGGQFPEIELEVRKRRATGTYAPATGTFHETANGATVIIDTVNGRYFTATAYGPVVWNAMLEGCDAGRIIAAFAAAGFADARGIVEPFVDALLAEGLITPRAPGESTAPGNLHVERRAGPALAILTCHGEAKALIAMHPLSKAGWPHREGA